MEGMVRENKDTFSVSPRNGKTGWWMVAMISLVIGISLPSISSAAATPFLPAEDKGSSTAQNSILQSVDSENLTSVHNVSNSDSVKNQIQLAKDGKSFPDTFKVIQGEGCDYDPPYWSSHKPFRGQPNVPISQRTFEFMLRDDRSGVDLRTFHLVVDGIDIYANSVGLTLTGNPQKYSIFYRLPSNRTFFWGDTVWVKLDVCDLNDPPNCMADSMFFVMEPDLDPPIIIPAGPMPGDINIAVNSPVKLSVLDARAGIDFTSIKLLLNGIDYSDSLTILQGQTPNVVVNSAQRTIFNYNQEVVVFAEVMDLVGNKADTTYSFKIQSEPFPPAITFIYPTRNSDKFLAVNDSLVFQIKDVHSQIDTSKTEITLKLNNILVNSRVIAISSSPDEKVFTYTIRPAAPVKCNMTGQLRVQGVDKSGNSVVDSTRFKYFEDKIGPEIIVIRPQQNATEVALNHVVEFEVRDNIAGVDKDLIEVFINGDNRSDSLTIQQVEPLAKRFHISLLNTGYWNDTISVKIIARDLAWTANRTELTYRYFIKRDDQGPLITVINPLPMQEGVLLSHVVEFEVEDILAGVNSDSIKIEVNGIDKTASLIKNEIVSSFKKFRVTLANTGAWNNTISIKIAAHDLSVPPNKSEVNFQYFMAKDLQGPVVTAEYPKPNQQNIMPENVKIQFMLEDNSAGVDLTSLKFYVKDKSIPISDLRPLDKNDKEEDRTIHHIGYSYNAGNFDLGEKVRVRVNVADGAGNPATGDTDYNFTITKDPYPPKIKIIQPLEDEKNVNRYLPVIFEVTDLESGINTNSIVVKINNEVVKTIISPNFTQAFIPRQNFDTSFRVIFNPTLPYNWNSTMTASITVEDSVGHPASLTYQFSTQEDRVGPEFINLSPAPNSVNILSNTPISIGIQDLLSGVNIESFVLSINGTLIPKESISVMETKYNANDLMHNQQVPQYYLVKYVPSKRYAPGNPLLIQLEAKDLVGNKSIYDYRINIFKDLSEPIINLITPPLLDNVARKTPIEFEVKDPESGIKMQLTELWVNGKKISINPTQISGDIFIRVLTDSLGFFDYGAKIPVRIIAVNNDGVQAIKDYIFNIIKDTSGPVIKLIQPQNRASLKTPVVFQLIDKETGINLTKSSFEIDQCIDGKVVVPTITQPMIDQFRLIKKELNGTGYEISYNSQGLRRFAYFQKVLIRIKTENAPKYHEAKSALFETIINITPGDTTPPWVTNLKPLVNEVNVLPGSNIKFDVLDDSMGVDPSSIKVQVSTQKGNVSFDSTHKAVEYGPKAKGFEVTINPKIPFFYNDTVTVTIEARDKEPNIMAPFKYRFFFGLDKTAPVLKAIDPYDKQKNVTNTPVFKVLAQDPLAGIDKSTYQLRYRYWDAAEFIPIAPEFFEFNLDTIQIKAGTDTLLFDTTVVVQATVKDRVGNPGNLEYSFKVMKEDTISPSITLVKPQYDRKYDYHPDQLNEFIVSITDNYAEINTESIKIIVSVFSDTTKPADKSKEFQKESATWSGEKLLFTPASGKSVQVTCKAQQEPLAITKNQIIRMWVYAEDKFRNPVEAEYEFGTQEDRQAPVLLYSIPDHEAQDVSPDTEVTLKFTDDPDGDGKDYTGVNLETMRVWMRIIDSNTSFDNNWSKAELVYPGIMKVMEPEPEPKIELAEKSGKFSVNQTIYLKIYAEDRVKGTPNQLNAIIWFETPKEMPDLSFQNTSYQIVGDVGTDSVQVECTVTVLNEFARVNVSELSVLFEKPDGKKRNVATTSQIEIGESIIVTSPLMTIYKYGTQVIKVTIDPNNYVPEKDENNNSTNIEISGKTRIYAEPEIFSPNGDGINDETFIHCDGFDLQNPIIKIFDIQGRFIRDLTEFIQNPLRFKWDGRDQNGRIVVPGVYIYMLYDGNKTLGRGCVVVVL